MNYTYDTSLLKKVSRSFYITIRLLPKAVRIPISIAYMLARTADTITDTSIFENSKKLENLCSLRSMIVKKDATRFNIFNEKVTNLENELPPEKMLLHSIPNQIQLLSSLPSFEQTEIIRVIERLISGMQMDLSTFDSTNPKNIQSFNDWKELDNYIYFVAGSVGEFWTRVTSQKTNAIDDSIMDEMVLLGIDFGKSLQLTNIIRDITSDLRNGRCYIPATTLDFYQVKTYDLLSNSNIPQTEGLLKHLINHTLNYFISADKYIRMLPKNHLRLRLSILIPVMIGLQTLELLLKDKKWLDAETTKKISRFQTYTMIFRCLFCVLSNRAIHFWINTKIKRTKLQC